MDTENKQSSMFRSRRKRLRGYLLVDLFLMVIALVLMLLTAFSESFDLAIWAVLMVSFGLFVRAAEEWKKKEIPYFVGYFVFAVVLLIIFFVW